MANKVIEAIKNVYQFLVGKPQVYEPSSLEAILTIEDIPTLVKFNPVSVFSDSITYRPNKSMYWNPRDWSWSSDPSVLNNKPLRRTWNSQTFGWDVY